MLLFVINIKSEKMRASNQITAMPAKLFSNSSLKKIYRRIRVENSIPPSHRITWKNSISEKEKIKKAKS